MRLCISAEIEYRGEGGWSRPGGRGISAEEEGTETSSPGGEWVGDVERLARAEGLDEMRRRDSSSWASEEEKGRAPASEVLGSPCVLVIVTVIE